MLSAVLLTAAVSAQSVSAADMYLKIKGTSDHEALGVTLLVLNKGTSVEDIAPSDIKYINQGNINADGSFELRLPFFTEQEYDFYSNMSYTMSVPGNPTKTVYVSDSGTEKNTGESADSPITLAQAWKDIDEIKEIVLAGDTIYTEAPEHITNLTIKAENASTTLTLNSDVSLNGDTTFSNLTLNGEKNIFANGYTLKIDETVTSTNRLSVYGGANGKAIDGDTNITLFGGLYEKVYGGGNGTAATINGSTNVTLGGNANAGDGIDDSDKTTISPCNIYGGGAESAVTGKTNVKIEGNAVAKFVFGAGTGKGGEVYITPDAGNYGAIGSNKYFNENAPITADTTVTFAKEFSINSIAQPTDTTDGISTTVDVTAENFSNEEAPYMVVAVYDDGMLVSCDLQEAPSSNPNKEFNINCKLEAGKTYIVKAMLWNKNQKPLTASYSITVNK